MEHIYRTSDYYLWNTTTAATITTGATLDAGWQTIKPPKPKAKPKTNLDWLDEQIEATCQIARAAA